MMHGFYYFGILGSIILLPWLWVNKGEIFSNHEEESGTSISLEGNVLAMVSKEPITKADIQFEYQLANLPIESDETLVKSDDSTVERKGSLLAKILELTVERRVLYSFIKKQGLHFNVNDASRYVECVSKWLKALEHIPPGSPLQSETSQERLKARLCEEDVVKQYISEVVNPRARVSLKESIEYYEGHIEEFFQDEMVIVRQIVFASETAARKVVRRITKENFAELARKHSITPESAEGGLMRPFSRGVMPRVFDIAFTLVEGQITDILESTYGFHIFMLEKKTKPRKRTFSEAKPLIMKILLKEKQKEEYKKWVDHALSVVEVKVDEQQSEIL